MRRSPRPLRTARAASLVALGALLAACAPSATGSPAASGPSSSAATTTAGTTPPGPSRQAAGASGSPPAVAGPTTTPAAGLVVSSGPGWTPAGLEGPVPAPGSCHAAEAADGRPLPDPGCTPGAVDGTITQADLGSTLCRPGGYESSVRPPESLTEPYKYAAMRAYGDGGSASGYELDHLVPLEIGGSSDTRNLWPEPDDHPSAGVANSKDPVEDQLHDLVCAAVTGGPYLPLAVAQRLIATDWTTALAQARTAMVPEGPG